MKSWRDSGIQEQLEEFCSFQSQSLIRTGWVMSSWRDSQGSSWVFCPKTKAQSELQKKKGQSRTTKDLPEKTFRSSERSFLPENQPIRSHLSGSAQIRSGFNPPTAQMLMKHRRLLLLWVSLHPTSLQVVWGRCSPAAKLPHRPDAGFCWEFSAAQRSRQKHAAERCTRTPLNETNVQPSERHVPTAPAESRTKSTSPPTVKCGFWLRPPSLSLFTSKRTACTAPAGGDGAAGRSLKEQTSGDLIWSKFPQKDSKVEEKYSQK